MIKHKYFWPLILVAITICIYLYTAAPFSLWEDAPNFLAAIISFGIARPVDPVYMFLAHWFIYLPFGSVIFRIQFFSAILAGGSLILLYRLVYELTTNLIENPLSLAYSNRQLKKMHQAAHSTGLDKSISLKNEKIVISTGLFSMLALAFSYQFWSQSQNVEVFILDCFITLVVFNLLLVGLTAKNVFKRFIVTTIACGIATGTDLPVIACIFPSVLLMFWRWREELSVGRLFLLFLLGLLGISIAWSYLPLVELNKPFINDVNGSTLDGFWTVISNQGGSSSVTGLTWSSTIMISSIGRYFLMIWKYFTPFLIPFIITGAFYLWNKQRHSFIFFFLIALTNFVFSTIYLSGNQESWYLQSDIIFAVFAGAGFLWIGEHITKYLKNGYSGIVYAGLFLFTLIPLVLGWKVLDRHSYSLTQEYMDSLYKPIQTPAIIIGWGDLYTGVSHLAYVTNYKLNVIPVTAGGGLLLPWQRETLSKKTGINIPDTTQFNAHPTDAEYSKIMNEFFADNIKKYHIYITEDALQASILHGENHATLQINSNKYDLIPHGMLQEVTLKNTKSTFNLDDFTYNFKNDFPQKKPYFFEQTYKDEVDEITYSIALSYDNAANYLMYQEEFSKAESYYKKAYKLAPNNTRILEDLGLFYAKQDQPSKALEYYNKLNQIQPNNVNNLYYMAQIEGQLGKIDDEKRILKSILDNQQLNATYKKLISEQLNNLTQQTKNSDSIDMHQKLSVPTGWKLFTNKIMNIAFIYPQTLTLAQVAPQLISLSSQSLPDSDQEAKLFIYSNTVNSNAEIPFSSPGKFEKSLPMQINGYKAVMNLFNDSGQQRHVLLLQQGDQLRAVKYPRQYDNESKTIDTIIQSISPTK
ncbi:MAG TPA: DUF2723 domain-containing protein [Patescibacteria group bacterium]|nr:DUF2723 domain-containing protein [Patescibacteria group bacterium]